MNIASAIPVAGFVGCVITAAISDARTLRIPNILSASIAALFAAHAAMDLTLAATLNGVGLAAATLAAGFIAFANGKLGGGDVKLLSVCMAWAGTRYAAELLIVTGLAGGLLAVAMLSPFTAQATSAMQRHWPKPAAPAATGSSAPMPYGIAIAAGALVVAVRIMSA